MRESRGRLLISWDLEIFGIVVPEDHYLRNVASDIPWDDFRDLLAPYSCQDMGRLSILPVVMLKLEYLRYHHNLSDRQAIARAETDLAHKILHDQEHPTAGTIR
jgi:transposase